MMDVGRKTKMEKTTAKHMSTAQMTVHSTYDSDYLYPGTDGTSDSDQPGTDQPDKPCHLLYGCIFSE